MKSIEISTDDYTHYKYEFGLCGDGDFSAMRESAYRFFDPIIDFIDKISPDCHAKEYLSDWGSDYINMSVAELPVDVATAAKLNLPDEIKNEIFELISQIERISYIDDDNDIDRYCESIDANFDDYPLVRYDKDDYPIIELGIVVEGLSDGWDPEEPGGYWEGEYEIRMWWRYKKISYLVFREKAQWFKKITRVHFLDGSKGIEEDRSYIVKRLINTIKL